MASFVRTDFLFSARAWPENSFTGTPKPEYLASNATKILKAKIIEKSKKKKTERKNPQIRGGGAQYEG